MRILIIALLLAGCTSKDGHAVGGSGGDGEIQEITLKDGTPCAVLIGYQKGAVSCGWGQRHTMESIPK